MLQEKLVSFLAIFGIFFGIFWDILKGFSGICFGVISFLEIHGNPGKAESPTNAFGRFLLMF